MTKSGIIKAGGNILVGLSLLFIAERLWVNRTLLDASVVSSRVLIAASICIGVYALSWFLMVFAWFRLLLWHGQAGANFSECLRIYARTQIAKYIPGNVFHFIGRHVSGKHLGLDHGPLLGATVFEIIGQVSASGVMAAAGLFGGLSSEHISVPQIAGLLLIACCSPFLFEKIASRVGVFGYTGQTSIRAYLGLLPILFVYLLFFMVLSGLFVVMALTMAPVRGGTEIWIIVCIFALAWLIGFVVPGASAGFGVREAVITASLSKFVGEPASLSIALMFRVITVVGDFLFFLFSFARHRQATAAVAPSRKRQEKLN